MILTNYLGQDYYQEIDAFIRNFNMLPMINMQLVIYFRFKFYKTNNNSVN